MSHQLRRFAKPLSVRIATTAPVNSAAPFGRVSASEYLALVKGAAAAQSKGVSAKRETPEEDLQMECASWLFEMEALYPDLEFMFHTPNGGFRSKRTRGRLKAMGTRRGVPDWMLPLPSGRYAGLAIETKAPGGGRLTEQQKGWLNRLGEAGYLTGRATTLKEFQDLVLCYLGVTGA